MTMTDDDGLVQAQLIVLADFEFLRVKGNFASHENIKIVEVNPLWKYDELNDLCVTVARTMAPSETKQFENVFICHPETQCIYPDKNVSVSCGDLLVVIYHSRNGYEGNDTEVVDMERNNEEGDSDEEYVKMFNFQDSSQHSLPKSTKASGEMTESHPNSGSMSDEKVSAVKSQSDTSWGPFGQKPGVESVVTSTVHTTHSNSSNHINSNRRCVAHITPTTQEKPDGDVKPLPHQKEVASGQSEPGDSQNAKAVERFSAKQVIQPLPQPPQGVPSAVSMPPREPPAASADAVLYVPVSIAIPVVFGEVVQDTEQPAHVSLRAEVPAQIPTVPQIAASAPAIRANRKFKDPQFTPLQQCVFDALTSLGFALQPGQVKQLCLRGTSVEACTMYYIDNMHLFPPAHEEEAGTEEEGEDEDANGMDVMAEPAGSCQHDQTSAHVGDALNAHPHPAFTPLQHQIWVDIVSTGIVNLTPAQIVAVSKKSSSVQGCVEYYFNNPELFDVDKVPPLPEVTTSTSQSTSGSGVMGGQHKCQQQQLSDSSSAGKPAWAASDYGMAPVQRVCCICQDGFNIDDMYILDCRASHSMCIACLSHYIRLNVLGDNATQPHIPACPLGNGPNGCNHLFGEKEVLQVVDIAMKTWTDEGELMLERGVGDAIQRGIRKLYLAKAHRDANHMQCVNCANNDDESAWFALPPGATAIRVSCPNCDTDFCSQCRRSPCHYRCTCEEVVAYSRAWNEWLQGGQDQFIAEMRRQTQQYQTAHEDYENKRKEISAADDRFQELQQYEQYKAQRCKICPKCRRTIEKLEGCDAMICGQNYHGGDIQNGCGHHFNWSTAPAYVADVGQRKVPAELNVPAPIEAQQVHHEICHGMPLPCDNCSEPIVGPCIRCINCPAYTICLQCSASNRLQSGSHKETHICTVVFRNEGF